MLEIERKWLIDINDIPYDLNLLPSYHIEQSYVSFHPTIRVRKINDGEKYILTVKTRCSNEESISHNEYEAPLSKEEFESLKEQSKGYTISKRRYLKKTEDGLLQEIDIFEGKLNGLCLMEIEFEDEEKAKNYNSPEWIIKDVTFDNRYKNSKLASEGKIPN